MGYRGHETFTGKLQTPLTSNNNNFVAGAPGEPVLISLDDARTLFHEFGHALHGLLSEVNYPGLGGTPRDFVEYPSQVHEQWVLARPILDRFARHYKTGKPMPQALVDKVDPIEQVQPGLRDRRVPVRRRSSTWSSTPGPTASSIRRRSSARRWSGSARRRQVAMRHRLPQFNHLFASDAYSAGYYSYLWSEVMDADTREAFAEAGDVVRPDGRRQAAQVHPGARQLDRSRRGVPPVPRPRSGRRGAAEEARISEQADEAGQEITRSAILRLGAPPSHARVGVQPRPWFQGGR